MIKCYLIKLAELRHITDKACLAVCFDGREAVIPKSQIFGCGPEGKSESFWVAAWIVERKGLQYSPDRTGWYDPKTQITPKIQFKKIERRVPVRHEPIVITADKELLR